jgi:hypothetical protein
MSTSPVISLDEPVLEKQSTRGSQGQGDFVVNIDADSRATTIVNQKGAGKIKVLFS